MPTTTEQLKIALKALDECVTVNDENGYRLATEYLMQIGYELAKAFRREEVLNTMLKDALGVDDKTYTRLYIDKVSVPAQAEADKHFAEVFGDELPF